MENEFENVLRGILKQNKLQAFYKISFVLLVRFFFSTLTHLLEIASIDGMIECTSTSFVRCSSIVSVRREKLLL